MSYPVLAARLAGFLVLALFVVSCATNPATGGKMLSLVSESQEIQMGQQFSREVESSMPLVDDAELQAYVAGVGLALAAVSERPDLPWSFKVVDDPVVNAFALPGGPVYVTRGILANFSSEAEMAAVLGHEIGHITARHSVEQISRAQLAGIGLAVGSMLSRDVARYSGLASQGLQVLFLSFGRDDEHESDMLGVRYAGRVDYDVRQSVTMHEKLDRLGDLSDSGGIPSWLSTHPSSEDRIERLHALVDTIPGLADAKLGSNEYLFHIDDLVYGEDPRQGYFAESLFLHPDLRFHIRFPAGWQTANLPSVVGGQAPSQDAIVQLTLASGESSHDEAARAFFAQEGVSSGRVGREQINGLPATMGSFQAQTEQGVLEGIAAFLDHGGLTYRIMGYTVQGRLSNYQNAFLSFIRSFAVLTDRAALSVEPMRIELYTLERASSIAEISRRKPSPVSEARLAILNGVQETERIPVGSTIKWVVGEQPPGTKED
jgi:predicted Zn-dependent protease